MAGRGGNETCADVGGVRREEQADEWHRVDSRDGWTVIAGGWLMSVRERYLLVDWWLKGRGRVRS